MSGGLQSRLAPLRNETFRVYEKQRRNANRSRGADGIPILLEVMGVPRTRALIPVSFLVLVLFLLVNGHQWIFDWESAEAIMVSPPDSRDCIDCPLRARVEFLTDSGQRIETTAQVSHDQTPGEHVTVFYLASNPTQVIRHDFRALLGLLVVAVLALVLVLWTRAGVTGPEGRGANRRLVADSRPGPLSTGMEKRGRHEKPPAGVGAHRSLRRSFEGSYR